MPAYLQIREAIAALIRTGALKAGDKLPGTRDLARQLGVSRKTVLQAYLELAADQWVESRPGSCTYVLDREALMGAPARRDVPLILMPSPPVPQHRPDASDANVPRMDWAPFIMEGQYFGMPRYRDKWKGDEEWISFSRAIPDVRLFPLERIKKVSSQMLWDPQAYFFDYGHPQGYLPLLEYIERRLGKEGVDNREGRNDLLIVSGFQLALNLLLTLLVQPGEQVVVEDPTFNGILNLLVARRIPHRGVPMEHDGMDVDYLERLLARSKPKLIVTIPTLHNPTGVTMSRAKRERLIALAQKYNVPVIVDDWAMLLGHHGVSEPSLKALDQGGHVIQIGSFSKAFLPGTRVAWVSMPADITVSFIKAKRALDRSDSYFLQVLVYEFIRKGYLDLHCRKVERIYRARRELTDELMHQHFPSEVSWKRPQGGFTFWVTLPNGLSSSQLLSQAIQRGVEFAPGSYFHVDRRESPSFRLAFSTLTQPQLRQGVKRLGEVIAAAIEERGLSSAPAVEPARSAAGRRNGSLARGTGMGGLR